MNYRELWEDIDPSVHFEILESGLDYTVIGLMIDVPAPAEPGFVVRTSIVHETDGDLQDEFIDVQFPNGNQCSAYEYTQQTSGYDNSPTTDVIHKLRHQIATASVLLKSRIRRGKRMIAKDYLEHIIQNIEKDAFDFVGKLEDADTLKEVSTIMSIHASNVQIKTAAAMYLMDTLRRMKDDITVLEADLEFHQSTLMRYAAMPDHMRKMHVRVQKDLRDALRQHKLDTVLNGVS